MIRNATLKLNCPVGETGNPAVTVTGAKITGSFHRPAAQTCTTLSPLTNGSGGVLNVKWKATGGKVNPTRIVTTDHLMGTYTAPGPHSGKGIWALPDNPSDAGAATVTGSYAGEYALVQWFSADPMSTLPAKCNDRGLKKLATDLANTGGTTLDLSPSPI